jgi:nicotinate-nucleotide adenylyltransferase
LQKSYKKQFDKIGILGGTFDPPHIGHLHISKIALKKFKFCKLIWVVAKKNPLKKKPQLKIQKRIRLSRDITNKYKKISVEYFDNKVKSNHTYELLKYIKKKNKRKILYFLIGADNLVKFHKWNNWKKIPKIAKIVVFARKNYLSKKNKYTASKVLNKKDIVFVNSKKLNISSSLIRKFWLH